MKKIVLSLAGVLAATAFAPEASALPAFARQTGMACNACHFQHFPVLNSFGRAFRASGYTMVGAQGKVEGEHLSLPDTLNAGFITKMRYQKTGGTDAAGTISGTTTNSGQWQVPDELGLIFAGRVGENMGMFVEVGIAGQASGATWSSPNAPSLGGIKLPFIYDVGGGKIGVTPFLTDAQGPFFGYDQSSSGQVRAARWNENRTMTSAQNYSGLSVGAATGLAFSASNDMGYIAWSRYSPNHGANNGTDAVQFKSNAVRIAFTPNVSDWALHVGAGFLSGSNYAASGAKAANLVPGAANLRDVKGTTLDFQAQGQVAGKDTSVYVNYGKSDAGAASCTAASNVGCNVYNGTRITDRKAWVVAGDYSVIPHVLSIGAAYRSGRAGYTAANQAAGLINDKDNAFTISAVYDLYQNVALHLSHSMLSGSAYGVNGTIGGATGVPANGKSDTIFMLEAAW